MKTGFATAIALLFPCSCLCQSQIFRCGLEYTQEVAYAKANRCLCVTCKSAHTDNRVNSESKTKQLATSMTETRVGSSAELWFQRSAVEKVAYLEGFCQGITPGNRANLGELFCQPLDPDLSSKEIKLRFCGIAALSRSNEQSSAVSFFDSFYKDHTHSHIPTWAVIASYNDKMCSEETISNNIEKYQKEQSCLNDLLNMGSSVAPAARKIQSEYCKSLKWR